MSITYAVLAAEGGGKSGSADVPAFKQFTAGIADRCEEQPVAMGATVVGAHRMLGRRPR